MKSISLSDRFFVDGSPEECRFVVVNGKLNLYKLTDDVWDAKPIISLPLKQTNNWYDITTDINLLVWDASKGTKRPLEEFYSECQLKELALGAKFKFNLAGQDTMMRVSYPGCDANCCFALSLNDHIIRKFSNNAVVCEVPN